MSNGELRTWRQRGVDGFVCESHRLKRLGGKHSFTGGPRIPAGKRYKLQRRLRASPAVRLAKTGRLKLYLSFYMVNYYNAQTPLKGWFDDGGWERAVLPKVRDIASAARSLGFSGVATDQELYPNGIAATASWSWDYPGRSRGEVAVRGKVKQRGRQLMRAMVGAFPGIEVVAYDTQIPGNWSEKVHAEINDSPNAWASDVRVDLWDGLSSIRGYSAIRWMDAIFYKTPHVSSWWTALQYNANRVYSLLSRRFSNWTYASARLHLSPFSWVDAGPDESDPAPARSPSYVADQLRVFRQWGSGGAFANFVYRLRDFDYSPYVSALQAASRSGVVDREPPTLSLTTPTSRGRHPAAGDTVDLDGVARDNFAIRAVRWHDERGREGVARLTAEQSSTGPNPWLMRWSIDDLPLRGRTTRLTISAEDIKGLATTRTLVIVRS